MTDSLTLTAPDDWHIHLRDGTALQTTVAHAARSFARAIVMPNLVPPVVNAEQAASYRQRILEALPEGEQFEPLMTLYLTDQTTPETIAEASAANVVACKLYPAGATTNSDSGVTDIRKIYPALEAMQQNGLLLLIHGEVTDADIDIFDREAVFIERILKPLVKDFPQLKMVLEHITTEQAVDFVAGASDNIAATITAHHLLFNRNQMLVGGIRPHYFCLPILKRNRHQQALRKISASGHPRFFLGTDSAPHARARKETECGCAGVYSAYNALELYAQVFDEMQALDKLEAFASFNGPDFYRMPRNMHTVTLERQSSRVPASFAYGDEELKPIMAGEVLNWSLQTKDGR